jgi:hypothetical protein
MNLRSLIGTFVILIATANAACARVAPPASEEQATGAPTPAAVSRLTSQSPGAVWDDGLAEVAVYDGRWIIYGKERIFEARLITAKEAFDESRGVKADPPYEGRAIRDVLKENLVMEIPTDNYPYRFLRTTFVSRDNSDLLLKATVGSQEWCGNTFHLFRAGAGQPSYEFHSYFDGEGDSSVALAVRPGDLFRDQLFSTLRFVAPGFGERHIRLWPSWISNHARPMTPVDAVIRDAGSDTIAAVGREWMCRRIAIEAAGLLTESYWYSLGPSLILVRYESSDGRSFLLKQIERRDYWTRP